MDLPGEGTREGYGTPRRALQRALCGIEHVQGELTFPYVGAWFTPPVAVPSGDMGAREREVDASNVSSPDHPSPVHARLPAAHSSPRRCSSATAGIPNSPGSCPTEE